MQPGCPAITIGGCVAVNVHGKNHVNDGVFGEHILELKLFHPHYGILNCSRVMNSEIFELTVGGLGLTGIILQAKISLKPLENRYIAVVNTPIYNIFDAFEKIIEYEDKREIHMAWLDLSVPSAKTIGKGFLIRGDECVASKKFALDEINPNGSNLREFPKTSPQFLFSINSRFQY